MSQCFDLSRSQSKSNPWTWVNASKAGDQEPWGWVNALVQISQHAMLPSDVIKAEAPSCTNHTKTNFSAAVKMQFRNQLSQKAAQKRRSRRRDTKRAQDCSMLHEKWQTINKFLFPFAEPICSQTSKQPVDRCEKTWTAHQVGRRFCIFQWKLLRDRVSRLLPFCASLFTRHRFKTST